MGGRGDMVAQHSPQSLPRPPSHHTAPCPWSQLPSLPSPSWLPSIGFIQFAALGPREQGQRRGCQDQAPRGRVVGAADLQSYWLCTAPHLSVLFQVMLAVCHPPMKAAVLRLPQLAQSRPQVMESSAVLWSRSFPSPLPFTCSTHVLHTTAEPCRASMSHHAGTLPRAGASHMHSMKSSGNMAEGSAFLPCVLA